MRRIVEKIKKHCTTKKCRMCGIPLDGWRYKLIVKPLCKITPNTPDICCKCAEKE
jgi:hypothetical protein